MTGCCCESLFFQRNCADAYIATLDAGHVGRFDLFPKAAGSSHCGDEIYGKTLWGCLDMINPNGDSTAQQLGERWSCGSRWCDRSRFLLNLAVLYMKSRFFRLHDLLNNFDNFSFRTSAPGQLVLKIRLKYTARWRHTQVSFQIARDANFHTAINSSIVTAKKYCDSFTQFKKRWLQLTQTDRRVFNNGEQSAQILQPHIGVI